MALSYGFESNCKAAVGYDRQAFDLEFAAKDFYNAGEVAMSWRGICLDAGDLDAAGAWYQTGHEAGLPPSRISRAGARTCGSFRWSTHRRASRARRGDPGRRGAEARGRRHRLLATGDNPQQQQFCTP